MHLTRSPPNWWRDWSWARIGSLSLPCSAYVIYFCAWNMQWRCTNRTSFRGCHWVCQEYVLLGQSQSRTAFFPRVTKIRYWNVEGYERAERRLCLVFHWRRSSTQLIINNCCQQPQHTQRQNKANMFVVSDKELSPQQIGGIKFASFAIKKW